MTLETDWQSKIVWRPLASKVLVVAKTRREGTWAAYVDAVRGMQHDYEWKEVARHGTKLDERIARILFPQFVDMPYVP